MAYVIEFTQREYDNKWIRWELMDSKKKNGIGDTSTWNRFKWVITGVWKHEPKDLMKRLSTKLHSIEENKDGRRTLTYHL